jgi:tetratricopeptide (TPR) repeat protein
MHIRHRYIRTALLLLFVALLLPACTREAKRARLMSKADGFFKAGQYDEARIEYLNALRLDPKDAIPYLRIGDIWYEQGDILQALRYLARARELAPDNEDVHSKLGAIYAALGDSASARKEALAVLKLAPDNGDALVLICNATRNRQDLAGASQQLAKFPNQNSASYQLASAIVLFRNGNAAGGEKAVRAALNIDPKSYAAHLALADIYLSRHDLGNAESEYKAAADCAPPRSTPRLRYAQFELQTGKPDVAKGILDDMTAQTPDFLPARLLEAQIAFGQKKFDDALAIASTVIGRDPDNVDAHTLQARISMEKGDAMGAVKILQSINSPYQSMPVVQYQLAQAFLQSGNITDATAALRQAIATSPDYEDAILLLADINLRSRNPQAVVEPMLDILKKDPASARARLLLTSAYEELKQYDDAIAIFKAQIAQNPHDPQSFFMMGMAEMRKGDLAEARKSFESAQALEPNDLTCTFQLVDLDITAGDFNSALKRVQTQIAAQPKSGAAEFLLGKVYAAQKDWPNAEQTLKLALDEAPNLTVASELLTAVYIDQHDLGKAIAEVQSFLDKNPKNTGALMVLGRLFEADNQPAKAVDIYQKVLAVDPSNPAALNNLSYDYLVNQGDLDKAQEYAEKARALLPDDPGVADTLGWILYKKGNYPEALALLQESASKPPVQVEILYHLGMAEYMMDYPDAARSALRKALESRGEFPGKAEIAPKLAILDQNGYANSSTDELEAILKQQPGDLYAQMALGEAWVRKGESAKAAASFEQVAAQNPNLAEPTFNLAELYAGPLHDADKAEKFAEKARAIAPNDPRATTILGRIALAKGDYLHAYNLLLQVQDSTTDDAKAAGELQDFAWAAYSQGKVADARAAMQRIVKAAPPASYEAQDAQAFLTLTDPDPAALQSADTAALVTKQLVATPDYVPALMAQGQIRLKQGDSHGAADDYNAVLKRFPDFPTAQMSLARIYSQDPANQGTAYDLAVKAHNSLPDDPDASQLLGVLNYQRKDYAYAARLLQETAAKAPLDATSLYYLGMSLWQTKDKAESRDALQQAIAGGLTGPQLADAKKVLAELQK